MKTKFMFLGLGIFSLVLTSCKEGASFYTNSLSSQVFIQPKTATQYDFLWVMDNSGSMKPRRDYVRDNLNMFLQTLNSRKAIDYQMAVVTTDAFKDQGALVKTASGLEVVKSSRTASPAADFGEIINAISDSNTSFWEQGLENSYQAIFKNASKFTRSGVSLIMVYLTDENDFSCKGNCWGNEPENNLNWQGYEAERYIDFFKQIKKAEGAEVVMFPITGLDQARCPVPSLGDRYVQVAKALDSFGVPGSICDIDLAESYNNIARVIADRGNVFPLERKATGKNIKVYVDGVYIDSVAANYSFDPALNAVVFNGQLPKAGSVVEVLFEEAE